MSIVYIRIYVWGVFFGGGGMGFGVVFFVMFLLVDIG